MNAKLNYRPSPFKCFKLEKHTYLRDGTSITIGSGLHWRVEVWYAVIVIQSDGLRLAMSVWCGVCWL